MPGVGQNFQDHPQIFGLTWTIDKGKGLSLGRLLNPVSQKLYKAFKQGMTSKKFFFPKMQLYVFTWNKGSFVIYIQ